MKKVIPLFTNYEEGEVLALHFQPKIPRPGVAALFCHGYTSHKGDLVSWAGRLSESGIPVTIFDLPGHRLGHYCKVSNFDQFQQNAHHMFNQIFEITAPFLEEQTNHLILGGHSLGALLSLKASQNFGNIEQLTAIAVGLGMAPRVLDHIFNTPFYKSTLELRAQLVDPVLHPNNVFPWIKEEKTNLTLQRALSVYLLSGQDDLVVPEEAQRDLEGRLQELGCEVVFERPKSLSHHRPELAAGHIKKYLVGRSLISK